MLVMTTSSSNVLLDLARYPSGGYEAPDGFGDGRQQLRSRPATCPVGTLSAPPLFLTRNLFRGGDLLLLLGSRVGFNLLLCYLLMYGLRRLVAHIQFAFL